MRLAFLLAISALFGKEMEMFVYWVPEAKGTWLFEQGWLTGEVGGALREKGWEVKSWEREKYWPRLLRWGMVESWQELKWRLGFGLPEVKSDLWVFWSLGMDGKRWDFGRMDAEKLAIILWEPPTVDWRSFAPETLQHFGKVFTWDDDLVDGVKFFKFHYPSLRPKMEGIPRFEEKKFCTLIASRLCSKYSKQLYKEREKTIRFFEDKPGEFDLYGKHWEKRKFKNWRGIIPDKLAVLKEYKFCICYENTQGHKGYITEKIFDCFAAGSVPVYWGAPNITDYIPAGAFIDRRQFKDNQELYAFLKAITEEEYEGYLREAERFLGSEEAQKFTEKRFVADFLQMIN